MVVCKTSLAVAVAASAGRSIDDSERVFGGRREFIRFGCRWCARDCVRVVDVWTSRGKCSRSMADV